MFVEGLQGSIHSVDALIFEQSVNDRHEHYKSLTSDATLF